MPNTGEEIAGQYLKYCKGCEFIDYNVYTTDDVGEIDVVGINSKAKQIYLCEVAIHTRSGLRYTKDKKPDNDRLADKFLKDIRYAQSNFSEYTPTIMLWSPIVKSAKEDSKYNQIKDVDRVKQKILHERNIELVTIINKEFYDALIELRKQAALATEELKSPVMRYLQIEEKLKNHLKINT